MDEDSQVGDVVDVYSSTGETLIGSGDDHDTDGWLDTKTSKIEFVVPTGTGRDRGPVFDIRTLEVLFSLLLSFISSAEDTR